MRRFLMRRGIQSIATLFVLSILIFGLARATGDPLMLMLPMEATDQDRANLGREFGLDEPLPVQYGKFLGRVLTGDLGISLYQRVPVNELLAERLPNSLKLAVFSMVIAILISLPLGILSAIYRGSIIDRAGQIIAILGQSLPAFCVAIVLVDVFAGRLNWFPAGDIGGPSHYVLPGLTLGWFAVAGMMRLVRSAMIEILASDYVKLARVKGLAEWRVVVVHALKNALIPVITFSAVYFTILVTTAIVVETVFAWPGMGRLAYQAITSRDFPVIQAVVLVTAVIVSLVNIATDCLYVMIDPRIRLARAGSK